MSRLQVVCPRCGAESWMRLDHLGGQLQCKPCRTKFYLDATGHYAIGDRPARLRPPDAFALVDPPRGSYRVVEWLERLPAPLRPLAVGLPALIAAALLVRLWVAWASAAAPPESLEGRAVLVAEAFARGRPEAIAPLIGAGRPSELRDWIGRGRPESWSWAADEPVHVLTELNLKDERSGTAMVIATILPPGSPPPPDAPPPSPGRRPRTGLELPTYWTLDARGDWALDVPRTLRVAPRPR